MNIRSLVNLVVIAVLGAVVCSGHHADGELPSKPLDRSGPLLLPPDAVMPTENTAGVTPGRIPGSFAVTTDGGATYAIPLWVSHGRAGMQPELVMQYDSRSSDYGLLGVGWSLSGLSRVARCARTAADDGVPAQIAFSPSDAFCLDGERLILVNGTAGQGGAEYRTERDHFARILVDAADANGPTSFTVYGKDGRIFNFAQAISGPRVQITPTPDIPVLPGPNNVVSDNAPVRLAWALSRVRDRPGNTMTIHYTAPTPTQYGIRVVPSVMLLPDSIAYTGSSTAGDEGLRTVKFFYKADRDLGSSYKEFGYIAGLPWAIDRRLDHIEMWGPNPTTAALLRKYSFTYATPSVTGRLLLTSVTESDQYGASVGATHFDWEPGSLNFTVTDLGIHDISHQPTFRWLAPMDVNGDGKTDLVYIPWLGNGSGPNYVVRFSDGTGYGPPIDTGLAHSSLGTPPIAINIDGDNRDDMLAMLDVPDGKGGTTPELCFMVNLTSQAASPRFTATRCAPYATVGDLNGDGLTDMLTYDPNDAKQWQYILSQPGGRYITVPMTSGPVPAPDPLMAMPNMAPIDVVDIDGAGASSLLGALPDTSFPGTTRRSAWTVWWGGDSAFYSIPSGPGTLYYGSSGIYVWMDVNGDGLVDAVALEDYRRYADPKTYDKGQAGSIQIMLNTGLGFAEHNGLKQSDGLYQYFVSNTSGETVSGPNLYFDHGLRIFDYDGIGREKDLLLRAGSIVYVDNNPAKGRAGYSIGDHVIVLRSQGDSFATGTTWPSHVPQVQLDTPTYTDTGLVQVVDVNGDGLDDVIVPDNGSLFLYTHQGKKPDMLTKITDGYGAVTSITYQPISNLSVYTPGQGCQYPEVCLNSKQWVVSEISTSNGNGGVNAFSYMYADARADVRGRGYLGMSSRTVTDEQTGATDTTTYDLRSYRSASFYPFIGLPLSDTVTVPLKGGSKRVRATTTRYVPHIDEATGVYFTFAQTIDMNESETTSSGTTVLRTVHTVQSVDDYGNVVDQQSTTGDGEVRTYHADYDNDVTNWLVQRLSLATETSTTPTHETQTRRVAFTYDTNGLPYQEIIEPGDKSGTSWLPRQYGGAGDDGVQTLYRTYDRYPNGLLKRITLDSAMSTTSPSLDVRYSDFMYADPDQSMLASIVDAMGHKVRYAFHPGLGTPGASDDFNGILRTIRVDGLSRIRHDDTAGQDTYDFSYGTHGGSDASLLERTEVRGTGPRIVEDFDMLERRITRSATTRKDGQAVVVDASYDDLRRGIHSISLPHFVGEAAVFASIEYDNLGRRRFVHGADGTTIEARYDGLTTYQFDAKLNEQRRAFDQLGRLTTSIEVVPPSMGTPGHLITTRYLYGPFDELDAVIDSVNNTVSFGYDRLSRKVHVQDPDAGTRDYHYNAFSDVVTEEINVGTANAATALYHYDDAGRLEELDNEDGKTTWTWDTATNGFGFIDNTVSADGIVTAVQYDNYSRPHITTWTVGTEKFSVTNDRDDFGRVKTLTYPAVPGRSAAFAVDYNYAPKGNLDSILDHAAPHSSYYTVLDADAAGAATNPSGAFSQELFGDGTTTRRFEDSMRRGYPNRIQTTNSTNANVQQLDLHFDPNGNLDERKDAVLNTSEAFFFDSSDRMVNWSWSAGGLSRNVTLGYDDIGNFRSRMVMEDPTRDVTYTYDSSNHGGPHAVTARNGLSYGYDTRGRQTSAPQRTVQYTSFELPSKITTSSVTTFSYDSDHQRVLKRVNSADEWLTLAGLYERRKTTDATQHIFTISGLTGPALQVVWQQGGSDRTLYLHTDQLGSIDTISDDAGGVEHLKYDPYGQRVQPAQLDQPVTASSFGERRGFTGHENDDDLDLVNMQGRIFDPGLGRFLTADPVVTSPAYGQSYNPYSYALNNPVTLTDPSGFQYETGGGAPFAGDYGLTTYFSTAAPAPAQAVKVLPLGTTASIRSRLQSVGACSGLPVPAGSVCAFGVTLADPAIAIGQAPVINRYDVYEPIGGYPRGSNAPWGRVTRALAAILPSWARLNPDTKQAIDGALLLASIIPIGEVAPLLKQIGTEQTNAFFRRVLTGFHGTKGENVLGIIDKGGFIPKEGKVFLGDAPGPTFQYGADPAHGAAFSLEVEVPADGLSVQRISTPGIPNTTVIHSSEVVPATVKRMFVRTPDGEGGFAVQMIEGIDAIRAFFGR